MKFRHVVGDLRQIAGGARTWLGYFATEDPVGIGLGQLAAESAVATRGRLNRYTVNIANATAEPQDVTLSLDIYPVEAPAHPARTSPNRRS